MRTFGLYFNFNNTLHCGETPKGVGQILKRKDEKPSCLREKA